MIAFLRRTYPLLFLFSLLLVESCNSQSQPQVQPGIDGWKTLDESSYSIQYPPEWQLDQSGQMGTKFFLFSPLDGDQDNFRENVNLVTEDLNGRKINLEEYAKLSVDQIRKIITNAEILEKSVMKNGSQEYYRIIYTGDQGTFHLQFEQHYLVQNGIAYVLTLTCLQSTFSNFKTTGEQILNSAVIKS